MWLAPSGRGSEGAALLLGLTKTQLRDMHFWLSMTAMSLTLFHIALDWRVLVGYFRCLGVGGVLASASEGPPLTPGGRDGGTARAAAYPPALAPVPGSTGAAPRVRGNL